MLFKFIKSLYKSTTNYKEIKRIKFQEKNLDDHLKDSRFG